ncbi:MAG: hypothetical protein ACYTHM_24070 [Planctomycetota bacterium]|jgi:hypothetical protein
MHEKAALEGRIRTIDDKLKSLEAVKSREPTSLRDTVRSALNSIVSISVMFLASEAMEFFYIFMRRHGYTTRILLEGGCLMLVPRKVKSLKFEDATGRFQKEFEQWQERDVERF